MPSLPRTNVRDLLADAQEFGAHFPALAPILARPLPEPGTERLIEGMAYLAGTLLDRVRDFRQGAHVQLAERVCPWLLRPIPSATIIEFDRACVVPRWSSSFQLSPFRVQQTRAHISPTTSSLEVRLHSETEDAADALASACFYVDGELQEALDVVRALRSCVSIRVSAPSWPRPVDLAAPGVQRCGLEPEAALAPDPDGPPAPFSAVTDAFVFPHKFRFVQIHALACLATQPPAREVVLTFDFPAGTRLPPGVELRTNCAPARNLYETPADPVPLRFDALPSPIRVPDGSVYAVRDVLALRPGELPSVVPDVRRLTATPDAARAKAMFAAERDARGSLCVGFLPTEATARERAHGIASMRVLATSGPGGEVRTGELCGEGYRNIVPGSRYVAPPTGSALALRATRAAAVRGGRAALTEGLREALFLSVPSWGGDDGWVCSMHARVSAVQKVEVDVARRRVGNATTLGYRCSLRIDETPFQGTGELDLFASAIAESLSRTLPARAFLDVEVHGLKTQCHLVHDSRERA